MLIQKLKILMEKTLPLFVIRIHCRKTCKIIVVHVYCKSITFCAPRNQCNAYPHLTPQKQETL